MIAVIAVASAGSQAVSIAMGSWTNPLLALAVFSFHWYAGVRTTPCQKEENMPGNGNQDGKYVMIDLKELGRPIVLLADRGAELRGDLIATLSQGGCFRFDDGTTQNWSLDQAYNSAKPYNKLTIVGGFTLTNSAHLALEAAADPFVVLDKVASGDIFLESPDLSQNNDWQGIKGFSLDLQAWFWSAKYALPATGPYFAQLQLNVIEPNATPHHYAEWDDAANDFLFHEVHNGKPHHITWKAPVIENAMELGYTVTSVRVRLTTPLIHEWEGGVHAEWLIGNVCSER